MTVNGPRPRIGRQHIGRLLAILTWAHHQAPTREARALVREIHDAIGDTLEDAIGDRFDRDRWERPLT